MLSELENRATSPQTITQRVASQGSLSLGDPPEVIPTLPLPLDRLVSVLAPRHQISHVPLLLLLSHFSRVRLCATPQCLSKETFFRTVPASALPWLLSPFCIKPQGLLL